MPWYATRLRISSFVVDCVAFTNRYPLCIRSKWLAANLVLVVLFKYHVGLVDDESLSKTAHVVERSTAGMKASEDGIELFLEALLSICLEFSDSP